MSLNLVALTITPEQQATILAALPGKRKKLTFMESKSVDFVHASRA